MAHITAEGVAPGMAVSVYLRREPDGFRIAGIDREWPGRSLIDPRVVVRPVRNRYVELDAERQRIFDTYARAMNVKLGENLSPQERFRALSLSEQTTFDAITHALLHSTLTDEAGRPLGKALDLVAGLDRIAGENPGRTGDQQFRIYVTLQPNASEVLKQSREFVRDHDNTVYHPGYPHSYRLGSGVPSTQFSIAEDGLSADVDVDYRTSKMPQSLFNGHLTASNSDVRAGDNARRHEKRWSGFANWWSDVFGAVEVRRARRRRRRAPGRRADPAAQRRAAQPAGERVDSGHRGRRTGVPDRLADPAQLSGGLRRSSRRTSCAAWRTRWTSIPSHRRSACRQASLQLLEKTANQWGRPTSLTLAMNPILPWSPAVHVVKHAFERDFTIVEAPTELGALYECGATPPKTFVASATPEYGTYYGALLQVVHEGRPGGSIVFVWRRVGGEWRLVAYRALE